MEAAESSEVVNATWSQTVVDTLLQAYEHRELLQMYAHLIVAALFPIYIGAHASLRRPPSAAPPKKAIGEEEDEEERDERPVEGLTPSDAIIFPVLAGFTLAALYFLIKWLQDPSIINKILGYYFSALGVFGVGRLAGNALHVLTTFVFPSVWASKGQVYHVDPLLSAQLTGKVGEAGRAPLHRKFVEDKNSPLPGLLSRLRLSEKNNKRLWALRGLLKDHWIFKAYIHGLIKGTSKVRLNDALGLLIGLCVITLYNTVGKVWWLTNLMGFGFSYEALQLMSPTSFPTGSLVLGGLFIYDITMVFYTPLMVTVATSLDVPIKLVFPGPKTGSKSGGMLGLGDVVLPGIMMALALRFDLYLHYLRKQSQQPVSSGDPTATEVVRAPFVDATGNWGERYWTRSVRDEERPIAASAGAFPKTYFYASIIGYVIGMLCTVTVLNYFNHAQPALLYLVPGVLIALWGTAAVKGELHHMWKYTEDGSLEQVDEPTTEKTNTLKEKEKEKKESASDESQPVFLFSLSRPYHGPRKPKLFDKTA